MGVGGPKKNPSYKRSKFKSDVEVLSPKIK